MMYSTWSAWTFVLSLPRFVNVIRKAYIPKYYIIMISKAIQVPCFLGDERLSLCNDFSSLGHLDNWKPCPHDVNLSLNLV